MNAKQSRRNFLSLSACGLILPQVSVFADEPPNSGDTFFYQAPDGTIHLVANQLPYPKRPLITPHQYFQNENLNAPDDLFINVGLLHEDEQCDIILFIGGSGEGTLKYTAVRVENKNDFDKAVLSQVVTGHAHDPRVSAPFPVFQNADQLIATIPYENSVLLVFRNQEKQNVYMAHADFDARTWRILLVDNLPLPSYCSLSFLSPNLFSSQKKLCFLVGNDADRAWEVVQFLPSQNWEGTFEALKLARLEHTQPLADDWSFSYVSLQETVPPSIAKQDRILRTVKHQPDEPEAFLMHRADNKISLLKITENDGEMGFEALATSENAFDEDETVFYCACFDPSLGAHAIFLKRVGTRQVLALVPLQNENGMWEIQEREVHCDEHALPGPVRGAWNHFFHGEEIPDDMNYSISCVPGNGNAAMNWRFLFSYEAEPDRILAYEVLMKNEATKTNYAPEILKNAPQFLQVDTKNQSKKNSEDTPVLKMNFDPTDKKMIAAFVAGVVVTLGVGYLVYRRFWQKNQPQRTAIPRTNTPHSPLNESDLGTPCPGNSFASTQSSLGRRPIETARSLDELKKLFLRDLRETASNLWPDAWGKEIKDPETPEKQKKVLKDDFLGICGQSLEALKTYITQKNLSRSPTEDSLCVENLFTVMKDKSWRNNAKHSFGIQNHKLREFIIESKTTIETQIPDAVQEAEIILAVLDYVHYKLHENMAAQIKFFASRTRDAEDDWQRFAWSKIEYREKLGEYTKCLLRYIYNQSKNASITTFLSSENSTRLAESVNSDYYRLQWPIPTI